MKRREIRRIRKRLELSQAKLARRLGVAPNTVSRWESGLLKAGGASVKLLELLDRRPKLADELAEPRRTAKK